jgi:hypothetical protein
MQSPLVAESSWDQQEPARNGVPQICNSQRDLRSFPRASRRNFDLSPVRPRAENLPRQGALVIDRPGRQSLELGLSCRFMAIQNQYRTGV